MKINCAVIGYGYWGEILLRTLTERKEFSVKQIGDINADNLKKINAHSDVKATNDLFQILYDEDIDAVIISTIATSHYSIVKEALLNNKHVLVEKPFTCSYKEALELHELAIRKNKILMIDHILLYSEAAGILKKFLGENSDKISTISFQRLNSGRIPEDTNVLWDLAPHDLSMVSYLMDEMPYSVKVTEAVKCNGRIEAASFVLNYFSGPIVSAECSWINEEKNRQTILSGKEISMVYNECLTNDKKIKVEDLEKIDPNDQTYYIPLKSTLLPMNRMLEDFSRSIISNKLPLSDSLIGCGVVSIIEALNKSASNNNEEIKLDVYNEHKITN